MWKGGGVWRNRIEKSGEEIGGKKGRSEEKMKRSREKLEETMKRN
jgi:hypothetical protein